MTSEETAYHEAARSASDAQESQMFGKPCYKINSKAFCCFFQNEMVFKLGGANHADALAFDGSQLFDPSGKGRPMKEWVQVPFEYSSRWSELAQAAHQYVNPAK